MRDIRFKGKRTDNGEWVEGYLYRISETQNPFIMLVNRHAESHEVDSSTVCQYTGLHDGTKWEQLSETEQKEFLSGWNIRENRKNQKEDWVGKEIWENDIVSNRWCFACGNSVVKFGEYKDFHMPEEYQCGNLGFYLEHLDSHDSRCVRKDMMYFAGKCEVIGNVFDDPSLLEGDAV